MADAQRRVFISYARADSTAFVDRLEKDLKAQQFQPWVDRHGLEGGEEWMEIIQAAIDECQALVVVLSPGAVQSRFVRMEYRYASEIGKLVIPANYLATTTTPMDLRILQWVDFQADYEEGLRQLVQALSRLKASAPLLPHVSAEHQGNGVSGDEQILASNDEYLVMNVSSRVVTAGGQRVRLTPKEFDLLHQLMAAPDHVLTHRLLLKTIWGPEYGDEIDYLHVFIRQLRRKIEQDSTHPRYILTGPGGGYVFRSG